MAALILMYHDVSERLESVSPGHRPYVLDPGTFRVQMSRIASSGVAVVTVNKWCSPPRQPRALIVTFDDGHVSNHDTVLPVLMKYELKATFFVTAGWIGVGQTMNWQQIRALHDAGMEIGSHTLTHRPPSTLSDKELYYELSESRRILEDGLGAPVTSASSPTGFFNPRMSDVAREVGYRALCSGRVGLVADDGDPFSLNRVAVKRGASERQFNALLRFGRVPLACLRLRQGGRDFVRGILGPNGYLRLRKIVICRSG